ncbi:phage tail family protein [Shouchella clausii]|uniref:phage tail domain-containing protein n=1 Tax=Shouchella clausii TaxID=79880 RepID=UPI002DBD0B0A|nr:phage tail domain-containing protein [Shouchella clausii]MEB5480777.1 phage tail family protein [Shouchella clausii]
MIRESLYFRFNGKDSREFSLLNVSLGEGLYEEPLTGNRVIKKQQVPDNPIPYVIGVEREPMSFQLRFYFNQGFDDKLIREILSWLDVEYYAPLSFSSNFDYVYYAMPVDDLRLIHNGLKEGYVELTMECNSPYRYSPVLSTGWLDFTHENEPPPPYDPCKCRLCRRVEYVEAEHELTIDNPGDFDIKPFIQIKKKWDGDIKIENLSVFNQTMILSNLKDGEVITIDCDKEYVETNLPNTYRHNDFNEVYLSIPYGRAKKIKVIGSCHIRIDYEYIYK